jgi:hypothetical protein
MGRGTNPVNHRNYPVGGIRKNPGRIVNASNTGNIRRRYIFPNGTGGNPFKSLYRIYR